MKKAKKFIVMLLVLVITASLMISCSNSTPKPETPTILNDVINVTYANGFKGLVGTLNNFADFSQLTTGEESEFTIMGVNIGKVTMKTYVDDMNYSYDAIFAEGPHPGIATVEVGKDIAVSCEVKDGSIVSFSADMNGGSSLNVKLGSMELVSGNLPWDCSLESNGTMTVNDKTYTSDEAGLYSDLGKSFASILTGMDTEEGIAAAELADDGTASFKYSFSKISDSDEAWADAEYEGTITAGAGTEFDVAFTLQGDAENKVWAYDAIAVDGTPGNSSEVDKINSPYVVNVVEGILG